MPENRMRCTRRWLADDLALQGGKADAKRVSARAQTARKKHYAAGSVGFPTTLRRACARVLAARRGADVWGRLSTCLKQGGS